MRLAITDTCIFIDLHELKLTETFFSLELEIHTSLDVFLELYPEQQNLLSLQEKSGKFIIHSISDEERGVIQNLPLSKGLSETDKTVLFLAEKTDAMVLSSDNLIRKTAKQRSIERHGLIWIFDQLVEQNRLTFNEAHQKLSSLKSMNLIYHNNQKLDLEIDSRLRKWH
jgi:hypothetical protein